MTFFFLFSFFLYSDDGWMDGVWLVGCKGVFYLGTCRFLHVCSWRFMEIERGVCSMGWDGVEWKSDERMGIGKMLE